jgi:beta-lactamase class A
MASLVKVPIAIAAMKLVDDGRLHLDQMVPLLPSHLCPGHGVLASLPVPGISVSLKNLIELSLIHSDNTASDAILDLIGGPATVNEHLPGIQISRSLRSVLSEMMGVGLAPNAALTPGIWKQTMQKPYPPQRVAAIQAFFNDPRDTTTTLEMCQVLARLWRCEGMSRYASQSIIDAMRKCRTGARRLKGRLPDHTRFPHKTGSLLSELTADMGIIEGPSTVGAVAVCAFVMNSPASQRRQDLVLAQLGAAVFHDYAAALSATAGSLPEVGG